MQKHNSQYVINDLPDEHFESIRENIYATFYTHYFILSGIRVADSVLKYSL